MSTSPDYVEKFVKFLSDTNWNRSLLNAIKTFIDGGHSLSEIDSLIMSVTKSVEQSLGDAVTRHQGSPVPKDRSYGIKLMDYAVSCGLVKSKDEPIYSLLYWILKEPRNTSHHSFPVYPYNTLVMFMSEANEAIEGIERLIQSSYRASFNTRYDQKDKKIKIEKVQIWRPNGSPLSSDQKVEAMVRFPDRKTKTTPLSFNGTYWRGEYDTRGQACGSASVYMQGVNHKKDFEAYSGSVAVISFPVGETCPNCGHTVTSNAFICPNCGVRPRIF